MLALAALAAAPFFLTAPGRADKEKSAPFKNRFFAHRGLFDPDASVPENSLPAFKRAVEKGCGIELDVQLSRDGKVVVFHDDTLTRVCGVDGRVDEFDFSDLEKMTLCGTDEKIPLFSSVLKLIGGKVPVIVELKTGKKNKELCEKTLALMEKYPGTYCVESFDPRIVAWFKKNAPEIFRGQLSQRSEDFPQDMPAAERVILANLFLNVLARPEFVAYRISKKPLCVKLCEMMGAVRFGWTYTGKEDAKDFDSLIFERCEPKAKK
ncbi:MAG: glycerophosphodiester phosphodiesterase [Clostridia bacterium]|nr:glycerophosphodiester phosphodiesterase [Clostridia bacterium]